mgnify:CR=1 FL=1
MLTVVRAAHETGKCINDEINQVLFYYVLTSLRNYQQS